MRAFRRQSYDARNGENHAAGAIRPYRIKKRLGSEVVLLKGTKSEQRAVPVRNKGKDATDRKGLWRLCTTLPDVNNNLMVKVYYGLCTKHETRCDEERDVS